MFLLLLKAELELQQIMAGNLTYILLIDKIKDKSIKII